MRNSLYALLLLTLAGGCSSGSGKNAQSPAPDTTLTATPDASSPVVSLPVPGAPAAQLIDLRTPVSSSLTPSPLDEAELPSPKAADCGEDIRALAQAVNDLTVSVDAGFAALGEKIDGTRVDPVEPEPEDPEPDPEPGDRPCQTTEADYWDSMAEQVESGDIVNTDTLCKMADYAAGEKRRWLTDVSRLAPYRAANVRITEANRLDVARVLRGQ